MIDDSRAGLHFASAFWNFAEELVVKETGAKLALPSHYSISVHKVAVVMAL